MSDVERATLEALAGSRGLADLLRSAALGRTPVPSPRVVLEVHATAWRSLGQGLGNLNQAVHALHQTGDETHLVPALLELRREVRSLRSLLLGAEE